MKKLTISYDQINIYFYKYRAMLNRFRAQQELELKGPKLKRPYHTSNCKYVPDAEKWRLEVIHEISKKVSQIQNGKFCWFWFYFIFLFISFNCIHLTRIQRLSPHIYIYIYNSWPWWVQNPWLKWWDQQATEWEKALGGKNSRVRRKRLQCMHTYIY